MRQNFGLNPNFREQVEFFKRREKVDQFLSERLVRLILKRFRVCVCILAPLDLQRSRIVLEHSRFVDLVPEFFWRKELEASTSVSTKLFVWITGRGRTCWSGLLGIVEFKLTD